MYKWQNWYAALKNKIDIKYVIYEKINHVEIINVQVFLT